MNFNAVSIILMDGAGINTYSVFPGFDDAKDYISLELCCKHKTVAAFADFFSINSVQDLENIRSEHLLERYENEKGDTEVFCSIDNLNFGGSLWFRKSENGLFAMDETTNKYHSVMASILDPEDFVQYTCNYFLLYSDSITKDVKLRKN